MSHDPQGPGAPRPLDPAADAFVARLRAADPARDHRVDLDALRAAVAARAAAPDAPPAPDELAAARARRWTTWPARTAAAAAAALLLGGGGGYAVGAASGEPDPAAPAIVVGEGMDAGTAPRPGALGMPETSDGRGGAADMWPSYGGRTVFTASGLSSERGSGSAWAYDASAAYTAERLAAAAAVLGVDGEVEDLGGVLSVGAQDGTGPAVQLMPDGTAALSYYDPSADPWMCGVDPAAPDAGVDADGGGTSGEDGSGSTDVAPLPEPEPCGERDLGAAPSGDAAADELRALLADLGLPVDAYEIEPQSDDTASGWTTVVGYHVVAGQRTGAQVNATWTGAGLHSLYLPTAPVVELGDYAVVSAVEAVERLMDPRFGAAWSGPVAYRETSATGSVEGPVDPDTAVSSEPAPAEPGSVTAPPVPAPGDAVAWPVTRVTITEARLGVAMHTQPSGAVLLLPTYELTADDGGVWTVLAITDDLLDFDGGQ